MQVTLRNRFGQYKQIKHGFSWTVFFFGFITPLIRGDWKWAIIIFIADLVTWGIASLVIDFFYNRKYIEERLSEGYRPVDEVSEDILRRNGYLFDW